MRPFTLQYSSHQCPLQILYHMQWQSLVSNADPLSYTMAVTSVHWTPFTLHHGSHHHYLVCNPCISFLYQQDVSVGCMQSARDYVHYGLLVLQHLSVSVTIHNSVKTT
jgi:hypothetical protein